MDITSDTFPMNPYRMETPYILPDAKREILERKNSIFQSIVHEFPVSVGKEASRQERDQRDDLNVSDATLTYGEVDFVSIGEVFETIRHRYGGIPEGGVFYDLGSGTGKGVVAAALLHNFDECRGIEILDSLSQISLSMQEKYEMVFPQAVADNPDLWSRKPSLNFVASDFFSCDWTDASFIFANSTCFDHDMMRRIAQVQVKPGTLGISFTKNFSEQDWTILESVKKNMSWGEATVYIQRKKETT